MTTVIPASNGVPTQGTAEPRPQSTSSTEPAGRRPHTRWAYVLAGGFFVLFMAVSLRRHNRLLSLGYDLGIFEQVIQSYAHGHLPVSEVKGPDFPVLGDHFSPVLALIAPLYRLWSSPQCLLVVQAALIAASIAPLALWARRKLGRAAGWVIAVVYGASWGIASGVGFDFHEVAFAVPLLAMSLTLLAQDRLRAAAWWALPLLLVKEDLGFTTAVIGLLITWRGERRFGLWIAVTGIVGSLLEMLVILPAFSPYSSFTYFGYLESSPDVGVGFGDVLYRFTVGLITPADKALTLVLLLAPTLFLALRSPLLWIAVPTLGWRFLSSNASHWGTGYHYSLILMPIVFVAFIDALARRNSSPASLRRHLAGSGAVCLLLLPQFPLWQLSQPVTWRNDSRVAAAHQVLGQIPDGDTVQAANELVPQLAGRTSVSVYGYTNSRPAPEWIVLDTGYAVWPLNLEQTRSAIADEQRRGYRLLDQQRGFVLLHRG
ncbi:DUF2079 domain-containing protein [Streptomyces sp. NPDC008343]|uniref:DUF2079 domain-containing protein n=1 Tax=Streptomyces sp. NPDC008343 TaxID=3364828 RepID=UPI0036E1E972